MEEVLRQCQAQLADVFPRLNINYVDGANPFLHLSQLKRNAVQDINAESYSPSLFLNATNNGQGVVDASFFSI